MHEPNEDDSPFHWTASSVCPTLDVAAAGSALPATCMCSVVADWLVVEVLAIQFPLTSAVYATRLYCIMA